MFIQLSQGYQTEIDDEDYDLVKDYNWHVYFYESGKIATISHIKKNGRRKTIYMGRLILGLIDPLLEADHEDTNPLNNKRSNLRIVTHAQNAMNQPIRSTNTTGYKGVSLAKDKSLYRAYIVKDNKQIHLGRFADPKEAAKAYNQASLIYHGEHGRPNIIN